MPKVVVVGLDGATLDVMGPMLAQGRLPNFGKVVKGGVSGRLTSTILPLSATAWSTFASGVNPGKHGIYDFGRRVPGTYRQVPNTAADRGAQSIWSYASQRGRRVCVTNVPLTYPPEKVNGVMVSGFPYPEDRHDYAQPTEVLDEIRRELGVDRLHKPSPQFLKEGDEDRLIDDLISISRDQTKVVRHLLQKGPWDLFVTVFDATDVISHFFWRYIDKENPQYDPARAAKYGPRFYEVYEMIDSCFGEVASSLSPDDHLFVISDHGFGPVYYAVYMNNWLMDNGYLKLRQSPGTEFRKLLFRVGITTDSLFRAAKKLGVVHSRTNAYKSNSMLLTLAKKLSLSLDDVDWKRTSVYSQGNYGQFFLNVKGREPLGRVEQGEEYQALVSDLTRRLRELHDPKTGRLLFDQVYTKDQLYAGAYFDSAPDIVFFDSTMTYRAHRLFEFGSRRMVAPDPIYSGSHRMDGIILASGPEIDAGRTIEGARLLDLAPTILHILELPIPAWMDGRPLVELFRDGSRLKQVHAHVEDASAEVIRGLVRKLEKSGRKI